MEKQRLLFEAVFKRMPGAPGTGTWLQEVATAHPYFSVAQFFLLQQTAPDDPAYALQARKTTALFNNPGWLHFQLLKSQHAPAQSETPELIAVPGPQPETVAEQDIPAPVSSPSPVPETHFNEPAGPAAESSIPEPAHVDEPVITPEEPVEQDLPAAETVETPVSATTEPMPAPIPLPEPVAAPNDLLFEPLHTTDYFASVGIKLSEQEKTNDRLGKQLKSFTDWLKTMKKVPGSQPQPVPPPETVEAAASESHIRHLAEQSNQEDEVLTEAMAGVLLQQGRREKAIEILEKLSLLNPSKSTYFAAKIHQIKGD